MIAAQTADFQSIHRLRLERAASHLHQLGPRPTFEALLELAECCGGIEPLLQIVEAYKAITPEQVRRVGADKFAPRCLRVVP